LKKITNGSSQLIEFWTVCERAKSKGYLKNCQTEQSIMELVFETFIYIVWFFIKIQVSLCFGKLNCSFYIFWQTWRQLNKKFHAGDFLFLKSHPGL